ncbi:MAG TPA: protein kinase [Candidatus Udaeobacter sp.]|nr:protein kinase [Candidatus Udaeobacter sp.]
MKAAINLSDSVAGVAAGANRCERCGATIRLSEGICLSCLLKEGLDTEGEASAQAFKNVLDQANIPDTQWRLGNYEILEEIGRGGMGVIYRARQRYSRRIVALKRVIAYHADSHEALARFGREAEAAASLDHPNILPIYEVGEADNGVPFFSMKLATGGSLRTAPAALRKESRICVRLMAKVARAVAYAHGHRILHRDLQPGNILLDARGEPLVSDFGLAKWLDEKSDLTQTLTTFGTPGYIAPEQAEGSQFSPAADIYSLGAILFSLIAGRPPFVGANGLAVVRKAADTPAPKLRLFAPSVGRDLETIVARCLERDPNARYQSAAALAEDLERWLEGRPITARPVSAPARLWRWSRRNPALAGAIIACLLLAIGVSWSLRERFLVLPSLWPPEKSVAVLPFENLSDDKQDSYFADGVQDEILSDLAKVADLKVISRASVMQYKADVARNLRQTGRELGVAHVVEGSVRRSGNRVRINAQLIDARTGRQLWGQTYERDLSYVFAIQNEIAQTIAEQLQAKLSPGEKNAIARSPTTDIPSFDLYVRAKNLLLGSGITSNEKTNLLQAADLLNQAIARDPSFLDAYCLLARANDVLYFLGHDHTSARLASAEAAIQAAARLSPDAGETHLARAFNLYSGYLEYDGALAELDLARQTLPNNPWVFQLEGLIRRRLGRWEAAMKSFERAVAIDPRNTFTLQQIAHSYEFLRRYPEEKSAYDRILAIEPNDAFTRAERAAADFNCCADIRPYRQILDSIRATNPPAMSKLANDWLLCALGERDAVAAENALVALGENRPNLGSDSASFTRLFVEGVIARMAKDNAKARSAFTAARAEQEKIVQAQPDYGPALCMLGLIDAGLGRKEDALREGRRSLELLPVEKDSINGAAMIEYLAMIAAWVGEKDLACEQLVAAIHYPSSLSYGQLKLLPFWDPLRSDARFEKIVASLAPKTD